MFKKVTKRKKKNSAELKKLAEKRKLLLVERRIKHLTKYTGGSDIRVMPANIWAFDPKEKILFYAVDGPVGIKAMTKDEFIGTTLHEIGHAKYTSTFEELSKLKSPQREYQMLLNALEDCRIERRLIQEFPGTEDSFNKLRHGFINNLYTEDVLKKMPIHLSATINIVRDEYGSKTLFSHPLAKQFFDQNYDSIQKAIEAKTTQGVQKVLDDKLWDSYKELVPDDWKKSDSDDGEGEDNPYMNTNSHFDQSDEEQDKNKGKESDKDPGNMDQLIKNSGDEEEEDEPKQQNQQPKPQSGISPPKPQKEQKEEGDKEGESQDEKSGDSSDEEGEENDDSSGGESKEEEGEQDGEEGSSSKEEGGNGDEEEGNGGEEGAEGDEEQGEGGESSGDGESDENKDLMDRLKQATDLHELAKALKGHKIEQGEAEEAPPKGESFMEDIEKEFERISENSQEFSKPDVLTPNELRQALSYSCHKDYEDLQEQIQPQVPYFSGKLKSIMRDNNARRFGGAYKKGKLASKHLHKVKLDNPRVFRQRILRNHKKYSVSLLIDQSGSMWGNKAEQAAKAAIMMAEVLSTLQNTGVAFEIFGFNLEEKHYKKFDQPFNWGVKRNLECIITETHGSGSGGNNDGYAVHMASKRLLQREGEKILLVFSDGCPNEGYSEIPEHARKFCPKDKKSYSDFDLKTEVNLASEQVKLIGIGIQDESVGAYYPEYFVINEVDELPLLLLNILKKHIRRG